MSEIRKSIPVRVMAIPAILLVGGWGLAIADGKAGGTEGKIPYLF